MSHHPSQLSNVMSCNSCTSTSGAPARFAWHSTSRISTSNYKYTISSINSRADSIIQPSSLRAPGSVYRPLHTAALAVISLQLFSAVELLTLVRALEASHECRWDNSE